MLIEIFSHSNALLVLVLFLAVIYFAIGSKNSNKKKNDLL